MNKRSVIQLTLAQAAVISGSFYFSGSVLAQAEKEPSLRHAVKSTDTIGRFAREVSVSPKAWQEVTKFNQFKDANVISIGQQLNIPLHLLESTSASGKPISLQSSTGPYKGPGSQIYRFKLSGNWGHTTLAQTSALQAVK